MTRASSSRCQNYLGVWLTAQSYAEAVANAEVVIDEWIETARKLNRRIPEARGKLAYA